MDATADVVAQHRVPSSTPKRARKVGVACLNCRKRHRRCIPKANGPPGGPCQRCIDNKVACVFPRRRTSCPNEPPPPTRRASFDQISSSQSNSSFPTPSLSSTPPQNSPSSTEQSLLPFSRRSTLHYSGVRVFPPQDSSPSFLRMNIPSTGGSIPSPPSDSFRRFLRPITPSQLPHPVLPPSVFQNSTFSTIGPRSLTSDDLGLLSSFFCDYSAPLHFFSMPDLLHCFEAASHIASRPLPPSPSPNLSPRRLEATQSLLVERLGSCGLIHGLLACATWNLHGLGGGRHSDRIAELLSFAETEFELAFRLCGQRFDDSDFIHIATEEENRSHLTSSSSSSSSSLFPAPSLTYVELLRTSSPSLVDRLRFLRGTFLLAHAWYDSSFGDLGLCVKRCLAASGYFSSWVLQRQNALRHAMAYYCWDAAVYFHQCLRKGTMSFLHYVPCCGVELGAFLSSVYPRYVFSDLEDLKRLSHCTTHHHHQQQQGRRDAVESLRFDSTKVVLILLGLYFDSYRCRTLRNSSSEIQRQFIEQLANFTPHVLMDDDQPMEFDLFHVVSIHSLLRFVRTRMEFHPPTQRHLELVLLLHLTAIHYTSGSHTVQELRPLIHKSLNLFVTIPRFLGCNFYMIQHLPILLLELNDGVGFCLAMHRLRQGGMYHNSTSHFFMNMFEFLQLKALKAEGSRDGEGVGMLSSLVDTLLPPMPDLVRMKAQSWLFMTGFRKRLEMMEESEEEGSSAVVVGNVRKGTWSQYFEVFGEDPYPCSPTITMKVPEQ